MMTTSRIQLALNVTDIDAATDFYRDLFGVEPAKQRPGYANFEIADPPVKLVLFHDPDAPSPLNHLGVEVPAATDVVAAAERFAGAGLHHTTAQNDRCCHAVQDKVWVDAPDVPLGAWEFYTVLADDPEMAGSAPSGACCAAGSASRASTRASTTTSRRSRTSSWRDGSSASAAPPGAGRSISWTGST
jgi:catechol 2,3-dioxygenase-like lactoylglutathione lyase family enzyme